MKKIIFLLALLSSLSVVSQKTDIKKIDYTIEPLISDYLKNLKTYNIIIQAEFYRKEESYFYGNFWDPRLRNKKMTYEHLMGDYGLDRIKLKRDTINPDLKIYVGYRGAYDKNGKQVGNYFAMLLDRNNKLIHTFKDTEFKYNNDTFEDMKDGINPMTEPTVRLAVELKHFTINKLMELKLAGPKVSEITKDTKVIESPTFLDNLLKNFPYGVFIKEEGFPELKEFNQKTETLISAIQSNNITSIDLNAYEKYYSDFKTKTVGKLSTKDIEKVCYLNMTIVSLFQNDIKKAYKYNEETQKYSGLLSMWSSELVTVLDKRYKLVNFVPSEITIDTSEPNFIYYFKLRGRNAKKEKMNGNILIHRFGLPKNGNIITEITDFSVHIFNDNYAPTYLFPLNDDINIIGEDNKEYLIKEYPNLTSSIYLVEPNGCLKPLQTLEPIQCKK